MKRERSFSIRLNELDYGSIYIKPTESATPQGKPLEQSYCSDAPFLNKCFAYFWYFFCCGYIREL